MGRCQVDEGSPSFDNATIIGVLAMLPKYALIPVQDIRAGKVLPFNVSVGLVSRSSLTDNPTSDHEP